MVRDVDERDAERLLTREQRKQLVDAEKAANAIKAKEEAEIEDAQRKAREEAEAEDKPNPAAPAKP